MIMSFSNTMQLWNLGFGRQETVGRWSQAFARLLWSSSGRRWILWDIYIGGLAAWSAFNLTPYGQQPHGLLIGMVFGILMGLAGWLCGIPQPETNPSRYELVTVTFLGIVLGLVLCLVLSMGLAYARIGRWIWAWFGLLAYIGILTPRLIVSGVEGSARRRVLLYGAGHTGRQLLKELQQHAGIRVVGFIDDNPAFWTQSIEGHPCLGGVLQAPAVCKQLDVELLCVAMIRPLPEPRARRLLVMRHVGVEIMDIPDLYERFFTRVPIDFISARWLLNGGTLTAQTMGMIFKRLSDVALSVAGLIVSLPLWLLVAGAIAIAMPGPVFFRQWRMGYANRPFRIIKFRTMRMDAEADGAQWADAHDERVTPLGRFLRLTRLDELPQLWNVLKGDMSLVGPRPERPEFIADIEKVIPFYDQRYLVMPGLSGWAQVRYHYGANLEDVKCKLEYDLYYIRNMSFRLDLQIMLRTLVMLMKGSR